MNIIKKKTITVYYSLYPDVSSALDTWMMLIKKHDFQNITELRAVFPTADAIEDNTLICFNIKGNFYYSNFLHLFFNLFPHNL